MSKTITWPCPAKLNLFLYINHRRKDGYHELQTLFQFLDYGDELTITTDSSGQLRLDSSKLQQQIEPGNNLIIKAAKLLQAQTGTRRGAQFALTKKLPMGGGVGGGSSDAATTLLALNYQWQLGLSVEQLATLGLQLGADVPVFVRGHAAIAEGVGEMLTPATPAEYTYLVVVPQTSVATATLFNAPELPRNTPKRTHEQLLNQPWQNDCEKTACKLYPEIGNHLAWLLHYAPSRMTGTGSCLFARFDDAKQAAAIQAKLPAGTSSFIAKGLNFSPLHSKLAELNSSAPN